jgi:hypothetical protein
MTCVEVNARVSVVVVAGIVWFKRPAQLVMFVKLMIVGKKRREKMIAGSRQENFKRLRNKMEP